VQTSIYQFVVLNKINRLTLKRFEQKYLLLSGFTFKDVRISPANNLCSIHVCIHVQEGGVQSPLCQANKCISVHTELKNNIFHSVNLSVWPSV